MTARYALRTKLSFYIALVALLTVALTGILSNVSIRRRFEDYIAREQARRNEEILQNVTEQYDFLTENWNMEFLHAIGMHALYDGYILRIYDRRGNLLWDAEDCDMEACRHIMEDITRKMRDRYPDAGGGFTTKDVPLLAGGQPIGRVVLGYVAPWFLDENGFLFLDALNAVFIGSAVFSPLLAVAAGWLLARRVSDPIRKTVDGVKRLAEGDYSVELEADSDVRELNELVFSVDHLARSIAAQETLRRQLTADVAHELRTPLTTLGTHIEAMVEGLWDPTRERLASCYEETDRIGRLVLDMENLAKVESGNLKLNKTPIDLRELAEKTLLNFETEIHVKKLRAFVEGSCSECCADRDRISQVLVNLISNAVKYTRPEGTIGVALSETEGTVCIDVEDDGIGVSEEDLPFIFERFYRADKSRSRTTGGSGIGLAIVRSIVTAHRGSVSVRSAPGQGSRFRVELPKNR
ncbi:MAG: HAMP domain-containing protein [Synergistaceae bacterium]|jgi:signal transduction histidine kinase|nr:HAMP domain-containing protein [Synergistaceae bacterium]